ncbi:SAM-dependent methyltransferase [Amycolatopsis sp. A1MSW2902]|uniref:cyclopropane-fatty-acyl-phospholipid synthase family protein n=1 Tax=Amycolatopsis sp. A1MSW2902 TaxID=687413 RepID=UPI00307D3862
MSVAEGMARVVGDDVPIEFIAYDGSKAGTPGAPIRLDIRSPLALSHLASAPGELGLARAYVSGTLEVTGDMYTALAALPKIAVRELPLDLRWTVALRLLTARLRWPASPPPQEHRQRGERHSKNRYSAAVSHHYDVSNTFYEWLLGPSMAYTCAVFPTDNASLEEAQFAKHDLVARKLALRPGKRLLDVGCGWGGMVIHAAQHYGARALGVTLSKEQAEWASCKIAEYGLSDLAQVRYADYRDVLETNFDAVSSIGLTEHIGDAQLPGYFEFLYSKLRAEGRLLNHCITRPNSSYNVRVGPFINRYVFPDGELESPGRLVSLVQDTGFEVRHEENLREHYAMTLANWCTNLDDNWAKAVSEVGTGTARVWRLYMAASRLAFERNNIQLHQILAVKPDKYHSGMPLRPNWDPPKCTS